MSLHYLDPEREPRDCPTCRGTGRIGPQAVKVEVFQRPAKLVVTKTIRSGGRLVFERGEALTEAFNSIRRIATPKNDPRRWQVRHNSSEITDFLLIEGEDAEEIEGGWYWYYGNPGLLFDHGLFGPYPTESAALEAARKASRDRAAQIPCEERGHGR